MASTGSTTITWLRPRTSITGDERDQREQHHDPVDPPVRVYLYQRHGGSYVTAAGMVRAHLYRLRWAAPLGWDHAIDEGWRLRDEAGVEYEVLDCNRTGRTYRIDCQRVG